MPARASGHVPTMISQRRSAVGRRRKRRIAVACGASAGAWRRDESRAAGRRGSDAFRGQVGEPALFRARRAARSGASAPSRRASLRRDGSAATAGARAAASRRRRARLPLGARDHADRFIRDDGEQVAHVLPRLASRPQIEKGLALELATEQRADPRAGDPERMAPLGSKERMNVSASTRRIAPGSISARSGTRRRPRRSFQ